MPPNDPEYLQELERTVRRMLDEVGRRPLPAPDPVDLARERLRIAVSEVCFIGAVLTLFLIALYLVTSP